MPLALAPALPDDRKLTLSLPQSVVRQLRDRMAQEDTTVARADPRGAEQVRLRRARGRDPRPPAPPTAPPPDSVHRSQAPPMTEKQVDLFLDSIINAPMKDDRALMEFPFFSLQKAPRRRPLVYDDGKVKIEVRPGDRGHRHDLGQGRPDLHRVDHQRPDRARPAGRADGPLQRPQPPAGDRPRLGQAGLRAAAGRHVPAALDDHPDDDRGRRDQGAARLRLDRDLPGPGEAAARTARR